ncbi:unnamed protein product [Gadus morhua 'NCC']
MPPPPPIDWEEKLLLPPPPPPELKPKPPPPPPAFELDVVKDLLTDDDCILDACVSSDRRAEEERKDGGSLNHQALRALSLLHGGLLLQPSPSDRSEPFLEADECKQGIHPEAVSDLVVKKPKSVGKTGVKSTLYRAYAEGISSLELVPSQLC